MKVISLVDNVSTGCFPAEHGLSLYIQLDNGQNILFDMGQHDLFAENARRASLSIGDVDIAVISHGHYDHGGGLRTFLELNSKAQVYIHKDAFQPHYSLRENGLNYIGLETDLQDNPRIVKCNTKTEICEGVIIFADVHGNCCRPNGNRLLFGPQKVVMDSFSHEQNLIIEEGDTTVLFAGCAHSGIVNIIRRSEEVTGKKPTYVFGGMHLVKSVLNEEEETAFISSLAKELMTCSGTQFHTMHCTGTAQYQQLKSIMGEQIGYLSCGENIDIT